MTLHTGLAVAHLMAGAVGLILAVPALYVCPSIGLTTVQPRRRAVHALFGWAYAAATLVFSATAFGLAAYDPIHSPGRLALATVALMLVAAGARIARPGLRRRLGHGWRIAHLALVSVSVIAFVTALAVQLSAGHPLGWLVPALAGVPMAVWRTRREVHRLRRQLAAARRAPDRVPSLAAGGLAAGG